MWHPLFVFFTLLVSSPLLAIEVPLMPHLLVSGYAEQNNEPDMLTFNIEVNVLDKQGLKAKQQVDKKVGTFLRQLEKFGIKSNDVEAGNLVVSPEYQYSDNKRPMLLGYRAQRYLNVKLYQLDKLSALMDSALNAGLVSVSQIEYGLKSPQAIREQVRGRAVEDAKTKAESLAKAFGMKLGKIYSVEYLNRSPITAYSTTLKSGDIVNASMMEDNSYQQQQVKVTDDIKVVFLLE